MFLLFSGAFSALSFPFCWWCWLSSGMKPLQSVGCALTPLVRTWLSLQSFVLIHYEAAVLVTCFFCNCVSRSCSDRCEGPPTGFP